MNTKKEFNGQLAEKFAFPAVLIMGLVALSPLTPIMGVALLTGIFALLFSPHLFRYQKARIKPAASTL